jgi:hypothetical protein
MWNAIARNNPINPSCTNTTQRLWSKDGMHNDGIHTRYALTPELLSCDGQRLTAAGDIINDHCVFADRQAGKGNTNLAVSKPFFCPDDPLRLRLLGNRPHPWL